MTVSTDRPDDDGPLIRSFLRVSMDKLNATTSRALSLVMPARLFDCSTTVCYLNVKSHSVDPQGRTAPPVIRANSFSDSPLEPVRLPRPTPLPTMRLSS